MKRLLTLALLVLLASCSDSSVPVVPETAPEIGAPTGSPQSELSTAQTGPNDWIVVFEPGVADPPGLSRALVAQSGGTLHFTYEHTIQGFAATLPPQALDGIRNNPNVERIEPDGLVNAVTEVPAASWGLDRIDQRSLPLSGTYVFDVDGAGVDAYVIDTGIRITHDEFGGRASYGADFTTQPTGGDDCHGHGTHVAGIIGGATYGVARGTNLIAVRVLDCAGSGSISGVIAGVDWVTAEHQSQSGPSVANMSLSAYDPFGFYQALNDAVAASVEAGVVYAVAASNDDDDACGYIPASEPQALTVGATDANDQRASFSNYGYCLDLFAPGVNITSAFNTGDDATKTWSGTSMASPHVAGVAALYLGTDPAANPNTVKFHILTNTTDGVVGNPGPNSPNKLLYSLIAGPPPPPPDNPPAAPTGLAAMAVSDQQIDLAWTDNADDEDGFEVERSDDGVSFAVVATVGADTGNWSDMGLAPSTTYFYRVRAYNLAGTSAWSNVAGATTDAEPPPPEDTPAAVWEISTVDIVQQGRFQYGQVGVTVYDADSDPLLPTLLPGITVNGDWYRDGDQNPARSSTGVTSSLGLVILESGKIKASGGLHFCVTSLSGPGYVDATTYPACSPGFTPPDPGDPGEPGAPSGLTATWSNRGGGRVELSWTPGGGSEVDVYRSGGLLDTTSDNGRYNDRSGTVADTYQVCVAGAPQGDPDQCTPVVGVSGP